MKKNNSVPSVSDLGEFGLISSLFSHFAPYSHDVTCGIGDDAAAVKIDNNRLLLATCDIQIDGVHFLSDCVTPEEIGQKAAAVNLSDIAAMGGTPKFALVSLAVPAETSADTVHRIYAGLTFLFRKWNVQIIGGNTATLPERLAVDITLLGESSPSQLLRRAGALPGDALCVTGTLGASNAGLTILKAPCLTIEDQYKKSALHAHTAPTPRIAEGHFLASCGAVTSCIDVSDGLLQDAGHIAEQSDVSVIVNAECIPISACATKTAAAANLSPLSMALNGGEDFELLFTVSPRKAETVLKALLKETGTQGTIIGEIREGRHNVQVIKNDKPYGPIPNGYKHFAK